MIAVEPNSIRNLTNKLLPKKVFPPNINGVKISLKTKAIINPNKKNKHSSLK